MVILTLSFKETLFYPLFVDNVHEIFIRICIYPYEPHRYSRHNRMAIPSPKPIKHLSNGADTDSQMCQMMRLLQYNYVSRLQLLISNARLEAERHSDRNWHGGNRLESTFHLFIAFFWLTVVKHRKYCKCFPRHFYSKVTMNVEQVDKSKPFIICELKRYNSRYPLSRYQSVPAVCLYWLDPIKPNQKEPERR